MTMTKAQLGRLLPEGESVHLDWKTDFPPELAKGRSQPEWDKGRGKLLRSLVALANSHGSTHAHLVYGVEDLGSERRVRGISRSFDDADFQQWAENAFDPPLTFRYAQVRWDESRIIGVFRIERTPDYPHVVQADLGGVLFEGQVWFRRGSKNTVALRPDLQRMFLGGAPFKIAGLDDPTFQQINEHYRSLGRETSKL